MWSRYCKISIAGVIAGLMTIFAAGCGEGKTGAEAPSNEDTVKISIVCTTFPQYDWARQIIGSKSDGFELTLLQSNRTDLHNYQPSVDDIVKITTCDLFIYVGGESDEWAEDILKQSQNPDMVVISLMEVLGDGAKIEEIIEGMEEEDDDNDDDEDNDDDDEDDYDEHVWLSLRNAVIFCREIKQALTQLEPANAEVFEANTSAYIEKLAALDAQYKTVTEASNIKVLLFGDRFPFRYLVDDYGIEYFAAFPGCSAETEASFDTVIFLAEKIDELNLNCIMVTESSDTKIAETIRNNTDGKEQDIHTLDAMQSISAADLDSGITYISIMENNLEVLRQALN